MLSRAKTLLGWCGSSAWPLATAFQRTLQRPSPCVHATLPLRLRRRGTRLWHAPSGPHPSSCCPPLLQLWYTRVDLQNVQVGCTPQLAAQQAATLRKILGRNGEQARAPSMRSIAWARLAKPCGIGRSLPSRPTTSRRALPGIGRILLTPNKSVSPGPCFAASAGRRLSGAWQVHRLFCLAHSPLPSCSCPRRRARRLPADTVTYSGDSITVLDTVSLHAPIEGRLSKEQGGAGCGAGARVGGCEAGKLRERCVVMECPQSAHAGAA